METDDFIDKSALAYITTVTSKVVLIIFNDNIKPRKLKLKIEMQLISYRNLLILLQFLRKKSFLVETLTFLEITLRSLNRSCCN